MSENWPLHSTPKIDELLSDWIRRIAKDYGVTYQVFCQSVLHLKHDEMYDLDKDPPDKVLKILAKGTGQPIDWLREMTTIGRRIRAFEALMARKRRHQELIALACRDYGKEDRSQENSGSIE